MLATLQDTVDDMKSGENIPFPWALWIFHTVSPIKMEQSQTQIYIHINWPVMN